MKNCIVAIAAIGMALAAAPAARAEGDPVAGERLVKSRCMGCHEHTSERSAVGANLVGVYGRKAGTLPGGIFSRALTESDIVWNEASLGEYLASPTKKVPWTLMAAHDISDAKERDDIIAYLKTLR